MSQNHNRQIAVLVILSIIGIVIAYYFRFPFWGGVITGSSLMLILVATIGRRMANIAAQKIDAKISLQREFKNSQERN